MTKSQHIIAFSGIALALGSALIAFSAGAQSAPNQKLNPAMADVRSKCMGDIRRFCMAEVRGGPPAVLACLNTKRAQLAPACQAVLPPAAQTSAPQQTTPAAPPPNPAKGKAEKKT
jgi:hypothetical protein